MGISIPCREIGGDCDELLSGGSMAELVRAAAEHARTAHGAPRGMADSAEFSDRVRSMIRATSRPPEFRAGASGPLQE